jgi:ribonuclease HII
MNKALIFGIIFATICINSIFLYRLQKNAITEEKATEICIERINIYQQNTDKMNAALESLKETENDIEKSKQSMSYIDCISEAKRELERWYELNCKNINGIWNCRGFSAQAAIEEKSRRDRQIEHCSEKFPLADKDIK